MPTHYSDESVPIKFVVQNFILFYFSDFIINYYIKFLKRDDE